MSDKDQALRPSSIISQLPTFIKEKEATAESIGEEEIQLASMANTAGWRALKEFILQLAVELEQVNETAIDKGADFEKLGQNALIISQAKGLLKKIVNKVEDARKADDKPKKGK